jgi:hypothetical protein
MSQYLFIVSRGNPGLFEFLRERFADDENVEVVLDRRTYAVRPPPPVERRQRPEVNDEIRARAYSVVRLSESR